MSSYIYESLGEVPANRSVIPADCLTFAEQSLYVAEYAEENMNKLFKSVGISELAFFESTGSEIVYEGFSLKEFKGKVVELFKKIWATIKAGYEKILNWFEEKRKEFTTWINKNLVKLDKSAVDSLENDKVYGKTHEFNIDDADDFGSRAKALVDEIRSEFESKIAKSGKSDADISEEANNAKSNFEKQIVKEITGTSNDTIGEAKKKVKESLLGKKVEVKKNWISSNFSELIGIVEKGNTKKDIKKAYKADKEMIDKAIKAVYDMNDEAVNKVAKAEISSLKNVITCLHTCMNIKADACKTRYSEYRNILVKVYHASKKKDKKDDKKVQESFTYQSDLIESAFNW